MHRFRARRLAAAVLFALATLTAACGGDDDLTTPPPTDTTGNAQFLGTIGLNGAATHSFTVTALGSITAQLTTWSPDKDKPVGLSLGTWNGSICQIVLANDNTVQGQVVAGANSAIGDYCVRIYDAKGNLSTPQDYQIDVFYSIAPQ